jgi:hypothetical protein
MQQDVHVACQIETAFAGLTDTMNPLSRTFACEVFAAIPNRNSVKQIQ